ncbi:RDD family protein [Actinomyces gaoshouyii]|uniref:RDD family protein n=1 Tax=Actinomyces gaoshouyii TaxID=1960083 RepID=UPI0009BE54CB|nr:RDD family protein [Actinomyces gaoshouyii]ARD42219.1 RDD family protein [Actinomyces gaoshouyii]
MEDETMASSERMMEEVRIVTGEAVLLDAAPASVAVRMLSGLIDYGLVMVGLVLSLITLVSLRPMSAAAPDPLIVIAVSLILLTWLVVLPLTIETVSRGSSIGRWVLGLRVVRDDGGAVRLRHCLVRALVGIIEIYAALATLAIASCAVTRRGKRLGDLLAGTYVVRDQVETAAAPPILMPPELASWAEQADLRALPGDLALVARTFLQRASTIEPRSRERIGAELAASISPSVSPPPPEGTHPERFLAAVLAERRDRKLALAWKDRRAAESTRARMALLPHGIGE